MLFIYSTCYRSLFAPEAPRDLTYYELAFHDWTQKVASMHSFMSTPVDFWTLRRMYVISSWSIVLNCCTEITNLDVIGHLCEHDISNYSLFLTSWCYIVWVIPYLRHTLSTVPSHTLVYCTESHCFILSLYVVHTAGMPRSEMHHKRKNLGPSAQTGSRMRFLIEPLSMHYVLIYINHWVVDFARRDIVPCERIPQCPFKQSSLPEYPVWCSLQKLSSACSVRSGQHTWHEAGVSC